MGDPSPPLDLFAEVDVFRGLSREELTVLTAEARRHVFAAGDVVCRQGEATDGFFVMVSGGVEVLKDRNGGAVPLSEIKGVAAFGEVGVAADQPRTATVRATEETVCWAVPRAAFIAACRAGAPGAMQCLLNMVRMVAGRLDRIDNAFADLVRIEREAAAGEIRHEDLKQFREQLYSEWAF